MTIAVRGDENPHVFFIGVTGTPGSGKTEFAKRLAGRTKARMIELNDLVDKYGLYSGEDDDGTKVVKMKELSSAVENELERAIFDKEDAIIIVGHLLPDLDLNPDVTVVMRTGLHELIARLEKRGYDKDKIRENVVSEAIDYCGVTAKKMSKKTYEVEADEIDAMINYIWDILHNNRTGEPKLRDVNRMNELLELVYEGNKYSF